MLFTRTIRRTMVCGLVIVLVMMILLSASAIYSHHSYRQMVRDLDDSFNKCPRKHELIEAIARLRRPLKKVSDLSAAHERQRYISGRTQERRRRGKRLSAKVAALAAATSDYQQKNPIAQDMVSGMSAVIRQIGQERLPSLGRSRAAVPGPR